MEKLSLEQFQHLTEQGTVIERDHHGDKVIETDDDLIVKLFRRKRFFSSALLYPYALRFKHNSEKLLQKGFRTVEVSRYGYCREAKRHFIVYPKLPGTTLRALLPEKPDQAHACLLKLAKLIADLHRQGVLFRSLHLGNVLRLEDDQLGLIDLSDMNIQSRPLSLKQRIRNFHHLLRYPEDFRQIEQFGLHRFITAYCENSMLSATQQKKLFSAMKS